MMEKYLKQRIDKILELDAKRTQGDWKVNEHYDQATVLFYTGNARAAFNKFHNGKTEETEEGTHILAFSGGDYDSEASASYKDEDVNFIAAAPEMAAIIKDQQARIEELEVLLDDADIWIPQMREAVGREPLLQDARMDNLEAWHSDIRRTLKSLGIESIEGK
jgi:hypothetical protein